MAKRKTHPTVDEEILSLLEKFGLKSSEALEQYACFLATNSVHTVVEEQMLQEKQKELIKQRALKEKELQHLNIQINDVEMRLEKIKELKKNYVAIGSSNFDEALHIITARIKAIIELEEQGKWDLKKVSFKEVLMICNYHRVPVEAVMSRVPDSMKKYIKGYVVSGVHPETLEKK